MRITAENSKKQPKTGKPAKLQYRWTIFIYVAVGNSATALIESFLLFFHCRGGVAGIR